MGEIGKANRVRGASKPNDTTRLETLVSDYVAGRLDRWNAKVVEILAQADPGLAAAIADARVVNERVHNKWRS
jgi:hypothetical protein